MVHRSTLPPFDGVLEADIEVAALCEFEVNFGALVAVLEDRHRANHLVDEFFAFDHVPFQSLGHRAEHST
jgi:hypothetical protein